MREQMRRQPAWFCYALVLGAAALRVGPAHGQTGSEGSVGYIDSALPITQFRLRYDDAHDDNRPERADFFYSKNAPGPAMDTRVNFQQYYAYAEWAPLPTFSGFIQLPYRYLQPDINPNQNGLSDLSFGTKYAFLFEDDQVMTFQLTTWAPTADGLRGLGTHNWNMEPALLYFQRLTSQLTLEAELRDFIPIVAYDNFAGNVLRYGAGLGYTVYQRPAFRVTPLVEMVGWTVLSGKDSAGNAEFSAAGETIVNAKFGIRFRFGQVNSPAAEGNGDTDGSNGGEGSTCSEGRSSLRRPYSDFYIGYGRALTGAVWYKDILRIEYRLRF